MTMDTTATTAEVAAPEAAAPELSERDRAIAAADALINAAGEGAGDEAALVPKEAPTKPDVTVDDKDEAKEARLAVVIRAKRQAAEIREKAQAEAGIYAKERDEARAEAQRLKSEVSQTAQLRDALSLLQSDPVAGLRQLGLDPRAFFSKAMEKPQALDPISNVEQKLNAKVEAIQKLLEKDFASRQEREQQAAAQREEREGQQIAAQFIEHVTGSASKYPTIAALYEDDYSALVHKADRVGVEFHRTTGESASWDDICEYLEVEEAKRIARVTTPRQQAASSESPPAARAKGKAPISTKSAGSTQTTTKPFESMSPEEQRAYAIQQADKAIQMAKGT